MKCSVPLADRYAFKRKFPRDAVPLYVSLQKIGRVGTRTRVQS